MDIEVRHYHTNDIPPFTHFWQARYKPKKFRESSPCEVRVRVYPEVGLDAPYLQEDERRGMTSANSRST